MKLTKAAAARLGIPYAEALPVKLPAAPPPDWSPLVALQCEAFGIPAPEREYRWHPSRKFRFDFAWPPDRLALEIQGGGWQGGRHHRAAGYAADCARLAEAAILRWHVLYATPEQLRAGDAARWVARFLGVEAG